MRTAATTQVNNSLPGLNIIPNKNKRDDNGDDDEEKLVPMQISTSSAHQQSLSNGGNTLTSTVLSGIVFVGLSLIIGSIKWNSLSKSSSPHHRHHDDGPLDMVSYTCPAHVDTSVNDNHDHVNFADYEKDDAKLVNKTTLDDFRAMTMDGWMIKYPEVKKMLLPWKTEVFVPHLQTGDSLYESACGIGMNLLASVEILAAHNIHNITVYGNDYIQQSADLANYVWSTTDAKLLGRKGHFCRGDSTNLDFVPSNSFDLVYTGYIDPIQDPLHLMQDNNEDDDAPCQAQSVKLCESPDPKDQHVAKQEQLAQEDWYALWVEELIRIAKPGKVIAVESIAESICRNQKDWGGVDKEWWPKAIQKYKWNVDPSSLVMRQVQHKRIAKRYNLMMKKNL